MKAIYSLIMLTNGKTVMEMVTEIMKMAKRVTNTPMNQLNGKILIRMGLEITQSA